MNRAMFESLLDELPRLTAKGFLAEDEKDFLRERREFLGDDRYVVEVALVRQVLREIPKSDRFSIWQREHCQPEHLLPYFRWRTGLDIEAGSIIAAAVSLGFTMGVRDSKAVYFNFSGDSIESELSEFRTYEQTQKVLHS